MWLTVTGIVFIKNVFPKQESAWERGGLLPGDQLWAVPHGHVALPPTNLEDDGGGEGGSEEREAALWETSLFDTTPRLLV